VKATVSKLFGPEVVIGKDLVKPDREPIPKYPFAEEGQEFIKDTGAMPEDFCEHAWYGIKKKRRHSETWRQHSQLDWRRHPLFGVP
jgi:uncharacterized repeat protein (TIGR04076 family)